MVRDLIYLTDDYSIRCCYGILVLNYWAPFDPGKKDEATKRRLHIFLYGFDMHVFNRNSLYGEFMLKEKNQANDSHQSQSQYSVQQEDALGWIWTKFESLFPVVRFHLEMSKFCFGNHLIPRALVLTCQKAHGTYMQKHATWQFDKYQHWVSFDFYDFVGSLVPVSKYSGHYAVEEPPQKADTFRVFSLGRGQITYKQDQPGLISVESEHAQLDENQESVFYTFPEWKMAINVEKDFLLAYGPWADRQREMLWKFFFPPTYRPAEVTSPPCVGQLRTTQKFTLDISSSTTVQMDLWFVQDKNKSNKFALHGGPDSTFKVTIPWVTEEDGSTVEMALSLANGSLVTDCLWHDLLTSSWFDLQLNVHYPRHWNSLQTWTFDLNGQDIVFSILYSQKDYIKGFFEDWSSGSRPDILYFVPYIYKFKIFAQPFDLRLLVNDYNWVAPTPENAFASLCLEKFNFDFDLPFIDFLPATVPIKFDINASSASLRLSVPETSTLLYLLKEMHANLRLANSNCKLQKNNPFRIIEETLPNTDAGKILHKRYWIECWRAIGVHVKIGYTYYPIVWVPDFWRFLPQCWGKHSSKSLSPTEKTHILAPRDPEEAALGDLRPEGSKARGPTESELIRSNFDPSYMLADQLDVHVAVPSSQLLFYGALIRYIIHFKENYFGCYQTPITAEDLKVYGLNEKGDRCLVPPPPIPGPNHPGKPDTVVDPREYRPFAVRVTVAIHNLQAHLPMHTSSEIPLCPTAFLDCIGFEMDKIFNETKLQLLFSPVLLCVFDKCNAYRPPNAVNLSTGRAQLTGLELRGQALFSNRGLPLKAETVEYAWLFEITCGTLTGEITAPQLSSIVQSVSNLIFSAIDSENAILSRRSGELCQHALVPTQCSFWSSKSPGAKLCPTELELKYRLFRFNLDGVELAIVEAGTCLMIMLDAVRVARCNMHDVHSRDGISVFLPRVQFLQLIKPLKAASQTLTRDGTLHSASAKTPLPSQPWLEAGSLGFGPVHLHSGISGLDHAYRDAQLIFIRHHDAASHRLWFLWLSHDSVSSSDAAVRCGCYGNCAFFGPNASGKVLLDEVLTGVFSRRAVFFSDLNSNASGVANDDSLSHPLTPFSTGASGRSLGVNFGESLFEPDQLLFQLHNSNVCSDTSNGFALMRLDAVVADEASKFETAIPSRMYYCSPEEEDKDSSFGALPSSSDEGPQNLKSTGDFWRKMGRKRGISRDRGNHTYLSTASLEKPLVAGEVEDGAVTGDRDDSVPDNLSLASLDGMSIGLPAAQILPPPPPPRQLVSDAAVTHVSTSSIPLFTDTADTPFTQRRGSTSSLHFNHEPSKASDDSTLSGEDFTAKFVDLHGQLNRPITESTLLRTAYVRHLNRYITNTELCPPLRLKHRWRVCRRFRDRQQCTVQNENGERLVEGRPKCGCRIGIAKAPEFLCSATGFSFRSMVDAASKTTISEITPTSSTHPGDTSSAPSSFRISDLRPLLYPHCCDAQVCESSTASVSRSSTTVSVLGPVDIFLTPLCTECIDRYITIMAPVLANRSPSSVIDELHFKCILSAGRQGKVLYEQQLKHQEPQGCSHAKLPPSPSLPQPTKRSMFFDQFSENTLWFHRIGGDHSSAPTETQVGSLGHRAQLDTPFHAPNLNIPDEISNISVSVRSRKQQLPLSDSRHHLAEENNLVGFLSLGRVNIGFMQIYAVEDIVTIDSLSLGLHDLTCVSLLTLAVDMVKIEVLNNRRILHYSVESHELESPTHSFSPDLFSRSLAGQRKLSEVQEEHDEDTSTAVSPLLSSPHRLETTTPRPDSQTAAPTSPSPRKHYAEDDVEAGLPLPTPVMRSCPSKVVSATEVRHTERLVCNFSISRIHSQLRRLTRESSFTPEVLLTAIPFSASRVFFAFDADQQSRAVTCKSPVAGGLYTGVHGPVPANPVPPLPLPHKPPVPSSSESFLPEHSAGWIMFESGMEELTLLFVQRKGYGDSLEEKSELRTTVKKPMPTTSVYHSQDENVDTEDDSADLNRNIGCSSTLVGDLENKTLKDDTDDENEGIKNAFLMNLHVKTVWLNFPAPKHLPNKCQRRTLSVLACLMMEAVKGDKPLPDFRFSSLEDEVFKTYSTLRTPDARRLRYDPSCQRFTTLRRYLQALRKQDGQASVDARLKEWLHGTDFSQNYRGAVQRTQVNAELPAVFSPKANWSGRYVLQHHRSPSITSENVNQINHLRGQFRFVDDAQRLFRPLLEAIGVNIKGVRRSTLMKKFGGLFAAEGMLDCFQIEICDSLENPLQKLNQSPSNSTLVAESMVVEVILFSLLFQPQLGDVKLRSEAIKLIANVYVDSISQLSNMPIFRRTHQFVTMLYCPRDGQNSVVRQRKLIYTNRLLIPKKILFHSIGLFKERSSNFNFSGQFEDNDVWLTEGIGNLAQEAAYMRVDHLHVLLSCVRWSRYGERNACTIGLGHVEITVPHHPVSLHGMVQRQARHLSTTVSEFFQLPNNPIASSSSGSRKRTCTDGWVTANPKDFSRRTGAEEHHLLGNDGASGPLLIINMTAIARGLTVNVSLHPSLNAMYTVDPVYFLGQVGPNGYLDVTINKHALSFQSLQLPIMFPQSVSLSLPKVLAFLARRQSPGGHCILGPSGERVVPHGLASRKGSYLDAQVSVGFFEQRLPSDRLNYIMVVVKLLMKEINEVIRKMAGEQQPWQTAVLTPGSQLRSRSIQRHHQQQQTPPFRRCSASMVPPEPLLEVAPALPNRFSVSNRFSFRVKFGGILLLAKTSNGAVKFETSEMHVELSNRIGRTHSSWYTDSSSSFSARPHPDLSGSTPPTKKTEKTQPAQDSNSRPQAPSDTLSFTSSESILIYAKIDHLSIELGHLDQDVFYEVWDQEFRTLAFFRTAIALRSLLAEEASLPTNQQVHRNHPLRSPDEGFSRSGHARSMPPRTDGDVVDTSGGSAGCVGGHSGTTSGASSVIFTPFDNAGSCGIVSAVGQEAFLVSLHHPIIWAKPSAFDRAILMWMVYNSEFAKWNEHIQQLDALSSEVNVTSPKAERSHNGAASAAPLTPAFFSASVPSRPVASPSPSSPSSVDNTSSTGIGSPPKRSQLRDSTPQPALPVPSGPILFFQLNVEDLGICLPTNILQLSPQSMEVYSRTALVLTLEQSRISTCLRGSLVSEGEFTDFCLRFDDDFNVGSDDWKPDKIRSIVTVKQEEHLVIMNACVVPSGTFRVCWKAVEALRAEERGRWLVKIQYQMRGLDLHMDDNIGRRLNALFDILTNMDNVEGEQQTSGCTGGGGVESGAKNGAVDEHSSSFQPNLSVDDEADVFCPPQTKALDHPILPIENTNFRIQEQFSQYRRLKWSDLRRKTTITSLPRCDLQRTGSLVKDKSLPKQISSAVPSPTLTEDDDDLVSVGGSLNACDLSVSSRTDSVYFDVEDPVSGDRQSAMAAHLTKAPSTLRVDKHSDHRADTYSLQDECLIGVTKVDGERTTSARGNFRQPPTPPPRKHASTKQPSFSSPSMEEPPRSSLLLELDINIHVDSGRCGLHPRLSKQEGGGKSIWPTSPAIGSPSLQDDLYKAYLARYKRQLYQGPLLKPTDISVFYLPALDVGLHYKSHTNYDLWNQQTYRTSVEKPKARPKLVVGDEVTPGETTLETVHDTQTAVADELGKAAEVEAKATKEASNSDFERSLDPSHRFTSGTNTTTGVYPDVGRSADLYASVVLQKLPQSLIVHPGLLDFLEQALENLPAALDLESDDGQSTQPKSSVQLNDALMTSTKTFLVDVVVHLCIQPSTIRFLCLPASQMQCLITLPSMNMIFSTERLAEEILKDADGKPAGRLSITANLADNIVLGDLVSASGLNVTAILNEFRMSVFHPYGGGIGGVLRTSKGAEGTSPGDSLTLKVRDIRLNISRTVQTNVVGQQQQQQTQARQSGDPDAPSDVRAATATMTSYVTANSGTGSISLHNIVRFSGVVDIGVAEFKCDTRRSLEILHIPKAWYRNSLARALFIGKDSKIPQSAESTEVSAPPQIDDENAEGDSDVVSEDEVAEKIPRNYAAPPGAGVDDSLAKWLQKGPRLRGKARIGAGTAAAPIKLTAAAAESASKRRSATAPREGLTESPTPQTVSNTTTLPPLVPPNYHAPEGGLSSTSRGGGAKVVSWQALPIFYVKIGNLDIQTYMGSAMGRTKLDVRNVFCDGRLYQDSSKRRRGSLGAGVHLCQFTSEQGVVGGEFTLLDLESRAHFKEDPRCDPQHSGELLIGGFQLRIEYMNTNIVFLRINQAEMYLSDEWRLREADHLCVSGMGDEKESSVTVPASRKFSSPPGDRNTETFVTSNIGAPPVYVMIAGEVNWDQLQVAIARTTTVDLMRSARKVREYFEEQLREGRNSWVGQGDYLLRPENSSVGVMVDTRSTPMDSLSLPTGSGETFEVVEPMVVSAALGFSCTEANVDKLLQRHWQYPMLEAIRACLAHIGTQAPLVRRSLLESTAPPNENSVPPVLGGSLQLAGNSLALACFAGTFRSAPDWAVFNMQHPTICFETEAQREPRHRPMKMGKSSTLNKKSVAFACEGPERLPESIDEVGGWLNVRQVLSFDLGHQLQYPPQTAYVLRVRRGREQNPVKLPVTLTIAEWLEFMFTGVDITVLSYVRGANPHRASDVVKLTEFSVDFSAHVSSTSDSLRRRVDAVKTSVATITASPAAGAVVTPRRPNPLKPPTEAEILFVLPSVSMRLTSDQRQSMAHPKVSELLLFSLDLQHEKATAAAEAAKKSRVTTASGPTPSDEEGEEVREGQESSGGDGEDEESEREIEGLSAKVHLSFQTDLHGVIQLGLLDVPWLPLLIKSYIDEQMHDTESLATPDPTYAVTPRTLELAKEGFLPGSHGATVAANAVSTASPIVKDLRGYDVIHWNLSPECRLLLASNIDVPAFDKFLENIGFHRARTTIPKWLQRGVLDHLDSAVAGLVHTSLRLADEQRKNQKRGGKSEQKPQERRLLEDEY
uniref:Fragile site associated protein C terminal n=1 Tax=Echinococcus granulosus TaxID=6210 RepID=A0A068WPG9_ECHGR|nr:Fragile site associated protein C terminal [Echinococcus granulosus]